ncbi:hypothetical protein BR93DRAFT_420185 [Coniochaeta sp. PMI_546]|nr:hypothetical protein BR93DRAFT_420185 [Coniochaeta sp. PMI_546]
MARACRLTGYKSHGENCYIRQRGGCNSERGSHLNVIDGDLSLYYYLRRSGCCHCPSNAHVAANVSKDVTRHVGDIPAKCEPRVASAVRAHKRDATAGLRSAVENFPSIHNKGIYGVLEEGVVFCQMCQLFLVSLEVTKS